MLTFLRYMLPVLAGLGAGSILDKFAADKLPNYPAQGIAAPITNDNAGGTSYTKIIWFLAAAVIGTYVTKFIGRKLNIKLLK